MFHCHVPQHVSIRNSLGCSCSFVWAWRGRYLLCVCEDQASGTIGICLLDAATAEFTIGQFDDDEARSGLETLLLRMQPKEIVVPNTKSSSESGSLHSRTLKVPQLHMTHEL